MRSRLTTALTLAAPLVFFVNLLIAVAPRVRGLGYPLPLRYAIVAPTCVLLAFATAFATKIALRPGRIAIAALLIVGLLESYGWVSAITSNTSELVAADVPSALFDVDHKYIDLPSGKRLHYIDEGRGPTILLLHGNPAWSFQWRALIAGLCQGPSATFRCVAPDYPGFGLSPAAADYGYTPREQSHVIEELVDTLALRDITLVMQDWGGPIGLGLAVRRPELVRSVVLGNTWTWPTTTAEPRGKFSLIAGGPIGEFAQMSFNGIARFAVNHDVASSAGPGVIEMYVRPFRPLERRRLATFYPGQIIGSNDFMAEVEAGLVRLRDRPALIFWGLADPGMTRHDLARFETAFPQHTTVLFEHAGHFFFEDEPKQVVDGVRTFMHSAVAVRGAE